MRNLWTGTWLTILLLLPRLGQAHEFWIEPRSFRPDVGDAVPVRAFVGDHDRDELPRSPRHIQRFDALSEFGRTPISGAVGRAPAGIAHPDRAGVVHVVYQSQHSYLELPGPEFERYLETEGLDAVRRARHQRGHARRPGRESFARYAKSLLRVGNAASTGFDEVLDLPIEIVPETDPFSWTPGGAMRIRIRFDGAPHQDALVKLISLEDFRTYETHRSNGEGVVSFSPPRPGRWLIATVHMQEASDGVRGDWESFWASLSFELATHEAAIHPDARATTSDTPGAQARAPGVPYSNDP